MKEVFSLRNVKFSRRRLKRYIGNIGEIIVQEVFAKEGFQVWLVTAYFPDGLPLESQPVGGRLIDQVDTLYKHYRQGLFTHPSDAGYLQIHIERLNAFFGDRLDAFMFYMEHLGVIPMQHMERTREYIYTPDLVAKRNGKMYIVEVKVNTGRIEKEKERKGLMLAKEYGFIPMIVTLNVSIEASGFAITEM